MKTGFVYILECADGSYYTGVSSNPEGRLWEHQNGMVKGYTHSRRPVKLVWYSDEMDIMTAIENEKRIKGWRREKKEALIQNEWERLPELSLAAWKKEKVSQ
jgi:putative endonuclease